VLIIVRTSISIKYVFYNKSISICKYRKIANCKIKLFYFFVRSFVILYYTDKKI